MKHVIVEKNNSYTFHEWWNKVPNAVCSNQYSVVFYNRIIPTNKINRDQFINLVKGSSLFYPDRKVNRKPVYEPMYYDFKRWLGENY
jgi:hypothetical protein